MFENQHFKDHQKEAQLFKVRLGVMVGVMLLLFGVLIYRYYDLQVINTLDYVTQSEHNRVHVEPIPPTRGLIYDASGEVIADNRPSYTLAIIINKNYDLDATLTLLKTLVEITPADLDKFYKLKKQQQHALEAIPLRYRLTEDEIARLAVNEYRLEGVQVDAELVRDYPHGDLFAHTVGYVSRISENDVAKFSEDQLRRYNGTHAIGKIGIESSYEDYLLGEVGSQNVETNARGKVQRVLQRIDPKQGKNITLHMDIKLQQQAADIMAGRRGAVVVLDVKNGGVLAAISNPGFDPNLFVTGIRYADYKKLNESFETPLLNRIVQGQFPSGSTVKPMIGLGGLHLGFTNVTRTISDPGWFMLPGTSYRWRDWTLKVFGGGHGVVNLRKAISESCDTYFYDLGSRMGVDNLHAVGQSFGLGRRTGIDIPNERPGVWPSREWKRAKKKEAWYPGDSVNMGIGQGYVSVTPIQLAVMTATLASRGDRFRPQLVKAIDGVEQAPILEEHTEVKREYWDAVFEGMQDVVYTPGGTLYRYKLWQGADYRIAGKSGTASVVGIAQGAKYNASALNAVHLDHVWFVGFAPADDPKMAIAILLENDDHISENPSLLARTLFDAYLRGIYRAPGEPVHGFPVPGAPKVKPAKPANQVSEKPNNEPVIDEQDIKNIISD